MLIQCKFENNRGRAKCHSAALDFSFLYMNIGHRVKYKYGIVIVNPIGRVRPICFSILAHEIPRKPIYILGLIYDTPHSAKVTKVLDILLI